MTPEQYINLFMQPKPQRRSFLEQSQYDYTIDVICPCDRQSLFRRVYHFIVDLVR